MNKKEIFNNLFDEIYFKINILEKEELKKVEEVSYQSAIGYESALKDFKKLISEMNERKELYLSEDKNEEN